MPAIAGLSPMARGPGPETETGRMACSFGLRAACGRSGFSTPFATSSTICSKSRHR